MTEVLYGKTPLGQEVYDIYFSSLSAPAVARKHKLSVEFVKECHQSSLRKQILSDRKKLKGQCAGRQK